jgi:hypothetical protein
VLLWVWGWKVKGGEAGEEISGAVCDPCRDLEAGDQELVSGILRGSCGLFGVFLDGQILITLSIFQPRLLSQETGYPATRRFEGWIICIGIAEPRDPAYGIDNACGASSPSRRIYRNL